jgi:hypothetical protein
MYFEVVDRPTDDSCSNSNGSVTLPTVTTIASNVTTHTPIYVLLGIASPLRSFQLCKGESYTIECPNNYAIAITRNIFGTTPSDQCEQHDAARHCIITTDPTFACRQTCTYFYPGNRVIPSCNNKIATYQYVEYKCIPTNTELISPNISCPTNGSRIPVQFDYRGRFENYGYPVLRRMNCTYRLKTKPDYIMHLYSIDISLNGHSSSCQSNKITLIEDGESQGLDFCEQRSYGLIYSSCSNELDLHYIVNDDTQLFSYGAQLYIESQERPSNWFCGAPLITSTAVPLTNVSFMGARDEVEHDICFSSSLTYSCPTGYTFMIIKAFYGVNKQASNKCGFIQGDCVQDALSTITVCRNDTANCYLAYSTRRRLAHCADNYADYLHITSQCVPSRPIEFVSSGKIYDICETNNSIADINGIVISPDFPMYRQTTTECKRTMMGVRDRVLKIWINEMAISSNSINFLSNY